MCGICGISYADSEKPVEAPRLTDMRDTLSHRGPDGSGQWVDKGVGLGHRRLSIIDVEGGKQPLCNEDGTVWLSFNGEIYNHPELSQELRRRGHIFKTRTDSETIVHAYEEYGLDCVRHLNGMFAFAIYDVPLQRLFLARDPLGIKPLFYALTAEGLFFASEIKAVVQGAGLSPRMRAQSLQEYLLFRYVAGENTFFEDIKRIPAGGFATWENGHLSLSQYWVPPRPEGRRRSLAVAVDELQTHLSESARHQLMSDVPLGAFCSGGVDSGLVTVFAAQARAEVMKTFSVGFEDAAWDETALARANAGAAGAEHDVLYMAPERFGALLDALIWYQDEPLSQPNSVPLYLLSKRAKQEVKVVLTGEGSDEMFAGYPRYQIVRLAHMLRNWPQLRQLTTRVARAMPGHRAARLAAYLPYDYADSLLLNSAYVHPTMVEKLTGAPVTEALSARREILERNWDDGDPLGSLSRLEMQTYLGCLLDRMDRMSMAAGLEARVPFLDMPLVEWASRIPSHLKMAGTGTKRVVKTLAAKVLPRQVVGAPKSGFGLPLGDWFRTGPLGATLEALSDPGHPAADLMDRSAVAQMVSEHSQGQRDHNELLWELVNVFGWHDVWAGARRPSPPQLQPSSEP